VEQNAAKDDLLKDRAARRQDGYRYEHATPLPQRHHQRR
jgi:hypothetical protein